MGGSGRFTKRGNLALGETIESGIERLGWNQRKLAEALTEKGIRQTTEVEVSRLINGNGQKPDGSLVLAISYLNQRLFESGQHFLLNPAKNEPYTTEELFDIALERLDPQTGLRHNGYTPRADEP